MAATANAYIADRGELKITISAADVTAIAAFTTAESITLDGAVVSFIQTTIPSRDVVEQRVTGSGTPITIARDTVGREGWTLVLVDDYFLGAAGEWGTDLLSAVEIFQEFFTARREISALKITPAGSTSTYLTITLDDPIEVLSISPPETNANSTAVATRTVILSAPSHTEAAHG